MEGEINFTPRRSTRCNKLEMSFREEDLRKSLSISACSKRTPSRVSCLLDTNKEVIQCPLDYAAEMPTSEEKAKNEKKRNKKSKKQKAKANQKRKEAKLLKTQTSNCDDSGEVLETANLTVENVSVASTESENEPNNKNEIKQPYVDVQAATGVRVENKPDNKSELSVESEFASLDDNEAESVESPERSPDKTSNVINLVTPDVMVKDPVPITTPNSPPDNIIINDSSDVVFEHCTNEQGVKEISKVETIEEPSTMTTQEESICYQDELPLKPLSPRKSTTISEAIISPRKSVINRIQTPYKLAKEESIKKSLVSTIERSGQPTAKNLVNAILSLPNVSPIALKEIKTPLRSALRKTRRSHSTGHIDMNTTARKAVVFNSPANTTINVDEVDLIMKSKSSKDVEIENAGKVVPMRRKRSLSVSETKSEKESIKSGQLNIEADVSSMKKSKSEQTTKSRVKVTNFIEANKRKIEKIVCVSNRVAHKIETPKSLLSSRKAIQSVPVVKNILQDNRNIMKPNTIKKDKKLQPTLTHAKKSVTKSNENISKECMHLSRSNSMSNITLLQEIDQKHHIPGVRMNRRFLLQMQHRDRVYK